MNAKLNETSFDQFKDYLLLYMPRGHMIPSGKEFSCACPFCGDSKSDRYATSFYINMDQSSDTFLNYHCFRASCGAKGIVDDEFFDLIGFRNRDCINQISLYFKSKNIKIGGKYKSKNSKTIANVINSNNKVSDKKLHYINSRLGLNLTFEDIYDLKINLSLIELLNVNGIDIPDSKYQYYDSLSNYGISFISAYNDYVIIRDISKSNKLRKRYTNINIFNNYDNVTKAYCIPTSIDLLDPSPTVINIAEGAFDIISVYYNFPRKKYKNQIYLAACGSNIINVIYSYIIQYGLINCKINIFSDTDVKIEKYGQLEKLKPYLKSFDISIYYNNYPGEKDFGVPKSNIRAIKAKL